MPKETVLLVDDEVNVISSLTRALMEDDFCEIRSAQNGQEALEIIRKTPNLAVVISDYYMPGMNGIELLVHVRNLSPDTSRVLLTGAADLEMAINAVNLGNVFRLLVKPCPPEVFIGTIKDGIRYYQLITGERELLSKTLNGSIRVMVDILAVQLPTIFAQASRLRKLAHEMAVGLQVEEQSWEIELAALLCQIGAVTVPHEILDKWQMGGKLKETEAEMIRAIPRMGSQLLKNIPRLEKISEAVGYQNCLYANRVKTDAPVGEAIPIMARILKIIIDFDRINERTRDPLPAMQVMQSRPLEYDPNLLHILRTKILHIDEPSGIKSSAIKIGEQRISVDDLKSGMVLTRDVNDKNGILIVAKGTVITEVLMYKLSNFFRSQAINAPIFVEEDS